MKIETRSRGYITLISTLVVGAVGLSVVTATILLGLGAARNSFALQQSAAAKALANACVETALEEIHADTAYTGSGGLTLSTGTCSYAVSNTGGTSRMVYGTGQADDFIRKIKVTLTADSSGLVILSWQDVADY